MASTTPTLSGFQNFIANVMGIDHLNLDPNSPVVAMAFAVALETVNLTILQAAPTSYLLAVYNLAASKVIEFAPDASGTTYFSDLRTKWKIDAFSAGVVENASDQGTSSGLAVPESLKEIMLTDLQQLKDPYGRVYLGIAQKYGGIVGVT